MFKKILYILCFSSLILFYNFELFAKNIKIITSIYPIFEITKNIIPDGYELNFVVPAGANPHTFEPTVNKATQIKEADLFISVSKHFDGWIEKFIKNDCRVIYLEEDQKKNPHIWLSPTLVLEKLDKINRAIGDLSPEDKATIDSKVQSYKSQIEKLISDSKDKLSSIKSRNFIQYHPAWDYFASDFGLNIVGTLSKGEGLVISPQKYNQLIDSAKKNNVQSIIVDLKGQEEILSNFSKVTKAKILRLDPLGRPPITYLDLIKENVSRIVEADKIVK